MLPVKHAFLYHDFERILSKKFISISRHAWYLSPKDITDYWIDKWMGGWMDGCLRHFYVLGSQQLYHRLLFCLEADMFV